MIKYAILSEKTCLVTREINGVKKVLSKVVPMWVGIVSPYKEPLIMFTKNANETILHTEDDILMVTEILHKKGIKHKVTKVEKTFKNFKTLLK
tara:strand:- start:151 stop:429 length:279 start_codon:yes stop_codon:yes gene_type:complete